MDKKDLKKIVSFLNLAENLKIEKRNSRTSTGERESVASHVWRVSLMGLLLSNSLSEKLNTEKALKMAIIHDIAETVVGDQNYEDYESSTVTKNKRFIEERNAILKIKEMLPKKVGDEIYDLWMEFELRKSPESKFINALDKIEAQVQDNEMDIKFWSPYEFESSLKRLHKYCDYDLTLKSLKEIIQTESKDKMEQTPSSLPIQKSITQSI